jgi:hypothetical protein
MTRRLALLLSRLARSALPPGREEWAAAMGAELEHIEGRLAPLAFSASCVGAAVRDRIRHVPSLALAGAWTVALLTATLALFQLGCAVRGTGILLGAPDPYLEALLRGTPDQRIIGTAYHQATPALLACLIAAGLTQLAAAWLLVRRRWRAFVFSSLAALACCTIMGGVIAWIGTGSGGLLVQFSALVLQAIAVPLLWQLLPSPRRPSEIRK